MTKATPAKSYVYIILFYINNFTYNPGRPSKSEV